jgi:molybdopterin-guanine dinucleotide biosynthesis protein A
VNALWIPFSDLADLQHSEKFFVNINTPEDYYEAIRIEADTSYHRRP